MSTPHQPSNARNVGQDHFHPVPSIPSQHLPHSAAQPGLTPHHVPYSQQPQQQLMHNQLPFHPSQPTFANSPLNHRPIHPLPSHSRHQPALPVAQLPRSQPLLMRHATPSSSQQRPQRHSNREEVNFRKRTRKIIGDGYEASYHQPGPSNRLLLSLKSGLPHQIDWALSRLAQHSASHRDLILDHTPGLADSLLSFVRRVCHAMAGRPALLWEARYFEQDPDVPDVGIGAPGEGGFQGATTWYQKGKSSFSTPTLAKLSLPTASEDVKSRRIGSRVASLVTTDGVDSLMHTAKPFDPARDPSHAALLRRALESALVLRNLSMQSANLRHLAAIKDLQSLIRDVLDLPSCSLPTPSRNYNSISSEEEDEWLELEGISELRLHFLDILEGLAARINISRRANFSISPDGISESSAPSEASGQEEAGRKLNLAIVPKKAQAESQDYAPGDAIFLHLLRMAHHSNDRAFLVGSLRCLCSMAANEKNEMAFAEIEAPDGSRSPGLLGRCIQLLPLTQDQELLEAVLDLLYQLVCIGNNGLKLTALSGAGVASTQQSRSKSTVTIKSPERATAKALAVVRLLARNLQLGRTVWERDHKLSLHREWTSNVPSRAREAIRKERERRIKLASETPEERAKKKRLTRLERQGIAGLPEPERGVAWMKTVFCGNPHKEVTQMEFWTAYKEEFNQQQGVALQPAADLIRTVSQVFPGAAAMVVPGINGAPNRFIIRGIEIRERDHMEPFRCCWSTCPSPDTFTATAQRSHAETHVSFARDGKCRWMSCKFDVGQIAGAEGESPESRKMILLSHVLTHLRSVKLAEKPLDTDESTKPKIVVGEDLRVTEGVDHTGEPPDFEKAMLPSGARVLRAKRSTDIERASDKSPELTKKQGAAEGLGTSDKISAAAVVGASGTVDHPGSLKFEVVRTPSSGADDDPNPQGPAFVSILILRMLTRTAASLLRKAGSKRPSEKEEEEDAVAIRGEGDDKFGLPLPASFGGEGKATSTQTREGVARDSAEVDESDGMVGGINEDMQNSMVTDDWAVDAAERLVEAVAGVEDDLVRHSYQNDILSRYINEILVELRTCVQDEQNGLVFRKSITNGVDRIDPDVTMDDVRS